MFWALLWLITLHCILKLSTQNWHELGHLSQCFSIHMRIIFPVQEMNILLWIFCEFSLPRLCIRFSGLLSGYFEMHIVCGNITQGAAIPHFDGGCRGGENRQGHLDFGFLDSWILCWGLAAWEMVKAHVRRSAAPLPLLLRNKYHPTTRTQKQVQCVQSWDFYKKGAGYSEWLG